MGLRRNTIAISVVLVATLCSGCVHYGKKEIEDVSRYTKLEEGKSAKKDIYETLGQPHNVQYQADTCRWDYYSIDTRPSAWTYVPIIGLLLSGTAADIYNKRLWFDENDTLINLETVEYSKYVNSYIGIGENIGDIATSKAHKRVENEMAKYGWTYDDSPAQQLRGFEVLTDE